jgi:hypothetical protein
VYETYACQTIAIIDAKGSDCGDRTHRVDVNIDPHLADLVPQPGSRVEKRQGA